MKSYLFFMYASSGLEERRGNEWREMEEVDQVFR